MLTAREAKMADRRKGPICVCGLAYTGVRCSVHPAVGAQRERRAGDMRLLISCRAGCNHDPLEVADYLDGYGDRASMATAEHMHDAADVVRGLTKHLVEARGVLESISSLAADPCHGPIPELEKLRAKLEIIASMATSAGEGGQRG